jgi:hypothetical protein
MSSKNEEKKVSAVIEEDEGDEYYEEENEDNGVIPAPESKKAVVSAKDFKHSAVPAQNLNSAAPIPLSVKQQSFVPSHAGPIIKEHPLIVDQKRVVARSEQAVLQCESYLSLIQTELEMRRDQLRLEKSTLRYTTHQVAHSNFVGPKPVYVPPSQVVSMCDGDDDVDM